MKLITRSVLLLLALQSINTVSKAQKVSWWQTNPEKTALLTEQPAFQFQNVHKEDRTSIIRIDPDKKYQTIDGFGFALTGGSAQHIINMSSTARQKLLQELFDRTANSIGISYLRVSIGSSDLNEQVFSYDDLPKGATDIALNKFDLASDKKDVIPVLKQILAISPHIKILASPWSAPTWMKTNDNIQGGTLKKEYYGVYANYFVKYIQAMRRHGIPIDAITIQNEPFNNGNTPSMQLFAKQELNFVKHYLGPLFKKEGITTKIILYDHNCDAPEYPISILTDSEARPFIDGSGFHLYAGPITALTKVHNAFPDKNIYFTEMMAVNLHDDFNIEAPVSRIMIGATRNWSRNVILWNLAADAKYEPHTDNGGCAMCQGAVTIMGDSIIRNIAYYTAGHFSKFVPPGSIRIWSNVSPQLDNVTFTTPTGKTVLIVANKEDKTQKFTVQFKGKIFKSILTPKAVASYVW